MSKITTFIKQHKVVLIIDVILIAMYFIITAIAHHKVDSMYSQQEAMRWENDEVTNSTKKDSKEENADAKKFIIKSLVGEKKMPYAQVSAFVSPGYGMSVDGISDVRSSIAEKLNKDSYSDSMTEGRVWIDAYSCETTINLRKDNNTVPAKAVAVGGDFFQFHPMRLLSGSYISESDVNQDRIVVDENFAWAMFGSNDIIGMQVWLNNSVYFVAGVVEVPKDKLSGIAYGNDNRIYMSYSELKKNIENLPITCYEAVLPNPISNYAYYALREAYGLAEEEADETMKKKENPLSFDDVEVKENTKRYNSMELITNAKNWKYRTMHTAPVGYPYWENVARVQEDTQMKLLIARYALLVFPLLSLLWLIYGLLERKTWTVKGLLMNEFEKQREKRNWEAYEKQLAEKEAEKADATENDIDSDVTTDDMSDSDEVFDTPEYIEVTGMSVDLDADENESDEETEVKLVSVLDSDMFE